MRGALAAGLILLVGAATAPASTRDVNVGHLKIIKQDLYAAITTESRALEAAKAGDWKQADEELGRAHQALFVLQQVVGYTEQPSELVDAAPNDPWAHFETWTAEAKRDDDRAQIRQYRSPKVAIGLVQAAQQLKNHMYSVVVNELNKPNCTELVDVRGPITVNGVPQGKSIVTVSFSCVRPVKSVFLDLIGASMQNIQLNNGTFTQLGTGVLRVDPGPSSGSTNVQVTYQPSVEPSPAEKLDVVEIAGDSSTEYFQDVM